MDSRRRAADEICVESRDLNASADGQCICHTGRSNLTRERRYRLFIQLSFQETPREFARGILYLWQLGIARLLFRCFGAALATPNGEAT